MKTLSTIIFAILISCNIYSQGLINAGASIVFVGGAQAYIDGATGNYSATASAFITPSTTSSITLVGNWVNSAGNNGFTVDGGAVVFNGAAQTIGGTSATAFYNATLQNTGTKQLTVNSTTVGGQAAPFNGVLSLTSRPLDLNSNRLEITNPATTAITRLTGFIISEIASATNPSVIRWYHRTITGAKVYPFGDVATNYLPFTFSITTAMAATGYVDASTRHTTANTNQPWANTGANGNVTTMNSPNGVFADGSDEVVIDRWWEITPSSAVTANVIFTYLGSENTLLPAYNTGLIGPQRWANSGGWVGDNSILSTGTTGVTSGTGTGFANGLSAFGHMVLSSKISPLPIELLNFEADCKNGNVNLTWCTASETDNNYFTVEQSQNGTDFVSLGNVNGNGTTTRKYCYSFEAKSTLNTVNYFRLQQVDYDGKVTTSKIISINRCNTTKDNVLITNNGTKEVGLIVNASVTQKLILFIYNTLGQVIDKREVTATEGYNVLKVDLSNLSNAMYYASVLNGEEVLNSKKIVLTD